MNEHEAFDRALKYLDEVVGHDPDNVSNILRHRYMVRPGLVDHPSCVVSGASSEAELLSPLGIIVGLVKELTGKTLAAQIDVRGGPIQGFQEFDQTTRS